MAEDSYKLDGESVKRIDRAVRRVLTGADASTTGNPPAQPQVETVWAMLTSKIDQGEGNPDKWEWVEIVRKHDGTFQTVDGGRRGDNSAADPYKMLAEELTKGDGAADTPTLLRRMPVKQADGSFRMGWGIIRSQGLPAAEYRYQVIVNLADVDGATEWRAGFVLAHNAP